MLTFSQSRLWWRTLSSVTVRCLYRGDTLQYKTEAVAAARSQFQKSRNFRTTYTILRFAKACWGFISSPDSPFRNFSPNFQFRVGISGGGPAREICSGTHHHLSEAVGLVFNNLRA